MTAAATSIKVAISGQLSAFSLKHASLSGADSRSLRAGCDWVAPAKVFHRAGCAAGRSCGAPGRAEIHQGLVPVVPFSFRNQDLGQLPEGFLPFEPFHSSGAEEDAAEHAPDVRVEDRGVLLKGEGENGSRRVAADPFES